MVINRLRAFWIHTLAVIQRWIPCSENCTFFGYWINCFGQGQPICRTRTIHDARWYFPEFVTPKTNRGKSERTTLPAGDHSLILSLISNAFNVFIATILICPIHEFWIFIVRSIQMTFVHSNLIHNYIKSEDSFPHFSFILMGMRNSHDCSIHSMSHVSSLRRHFVHTHSTRMKLLLPKIKWIKCSNHCASVLIINSWKIIMSSE